mmetsp:Transcript_14198/g.56599  ORF Transcript_14198/g.56599 Transcript_14198/m.56599 type:complete len:196 (+) Transcript_14198:312-899(+)
MAEVSAADARAAGFASRDALTRQLGTALASGVPADAATTLYRIRVRFAGADARIALRDTTADLLASDDVFEDVRNKLDAMDRAARGPWTRATLRLIEARPATLAADLAAELGSLETRTFKQRVRRLKELGLTESLERGYRLSPRGALVVAKLRDEPRAEQRATTAQHPKASSSSSSSRTATRKRRRGSDDDDKPT